MRSRYRSSVPSQARDQVARPPLSRGRLADEDDELNSLPSSLSVNLGMDQSALEIARRAEASGYKPTPWVPSPALPEAPTWYPSVVLPAGGPWEGEEGGDRRQSTVPPPTLPSFSSIGAAINAIHRLAEFFASEDVPMATQPAVDSQMQVDDVDLLSSAFDRLRGSVLGSAWAEQIQWEPARRPHLSSPRKDSRPTPRNSSPQAQPTRTSLSCSPPHSPRGSEGILPR
jgi:hypothetical protein